LKRAPAYPAGRWRRGRYAAQYSRAAVCDSRRTNSAKDLVARTYTALTSYGIKEQQTRDAKRKRGGWPKRGRRWRVQSEGRLRGLDWRNTAMGSRPCNPIANYLRYPDIWQRRPRPRPELVEGRSSQDQRARQKRPQRQTPGNPRCLHDLRLILERPSTSSGRGDGLHSGPSNRHPGCPSTSTYSAQLVGCGIGAPSSRMPSR